VVATRQWSCEDSSSSCCDHRALTESFSGRVRSVISVITHADGWAYNTYRWPGKSTRALDGVARTHHTNRQSSDLPIDFDVSYAVVDLVCVADGCRVRWLDDCRSAKMDNVRLIDCKRPATNRRQSVLHGRRHRRWQNVVGSMLRTRSLCANPINVWTYNVFAHLRDDWSAITTIYSRQPRC